MPYCHCCCMLQTFTLRTTLILDVGADVDVGIGVHAGKNIAECAARVKPSSRPLLITAVGGDAGADALVAGCAEAGIRSDGVVVMTEHRSAVYNAIHGGNGDLLYGVADMEVFEALSWAQIYDQNKRSLDAANLIVCDGNMSVDALRGLQGEYTSALI